MDESDAVITDGLSSWLLAGVASIIGTLAAVVAALWKLNESKNNAAIASLESICAGLTTRVNECETDRVELRVRVAILEEQLVVQRKRIDCVDKDMSDSKRQAGGGENA